MKKKKAQKTRSRVTLILAIIIALIVAGGIIAYIYTMKSYNGKEQWVYIPDNSTEQAVKDSLTTRLGDSGKRIFTMWKAMDGKTTAAHGAYRIKPGDREYDIMQRLRYGQQTPVKVVFNNIRTIDQLAEKIAARLEFDADDFVAACDSVLPAMGFKKAHYPAAFFPDSYEFYWTNKPSRVIERLCDYRNHFWNDERRAKARSMGLTPVDVATIASIVEEETAKSDERPKVARLYINRVDRNMPLQADPTVKFAVGDFSLRRITNKHLKVESPYNTYLHAGLPPGPIRIAAKSTLEAVLNAPMHNYLYMCAKEDFSGYHNFAVDYNTHLNNARRYQAELNRRKIYK